MNEATDYDGTPGYAIGHGIEIDLNEPILPMKPTPTDTILARIRELREGYAFLRTTSAIEMAELCDATKPVAGINLIARKMGMEIDAARTTLRAALAALEVATVQLRMIAEFPEELTILSTGKASDTLNTIAKILTDEQS